jgi:hypothetical protein
MQNPFSSITTAGLLLPLDLLTRVSGMDRSLPGMTPADYHVAGSIRLNEAATAAYSRALTYWKSFRKKFDALTASDSGTTLTRDEWLLPLFDCLGYGRLQTKRSITIDSKDYPISHGWEDHVPIHLLSARLPLDKRTQNVSGAATRSPYSLVQELINRSAKHRWGFVSNGLKFYVLRDNASLTRSANIEFDLETMMDGEYHADFTVLFLICHQSRLEIQPNPIVDNKGTGRKTTKAAKPTKSGTKVSEKPAKYALDLDDDDVEESEFSDDEEAVEIEEPTRLGPENCWLEAWTKLAGEQGTRAKERLRDGVQLAIQTFGAGFYTCSSNAALHQRLRSGELSTQDYYRQLLRLVYRLLMLMVAEDKRTESGQNLLHPIDTPAHIRDRYNRFYSVARIRKLANERRGTPHRDLYESLKTTFLKLRDGYAPLGIPGIGSFLFSDTATPDLDSAQITNEALLDAFRHLCFTDDATGRGGSIRRAVDFGNLGSEELGSIYESLLELHPEIDSQDGPFVLRTAAGNERKTSGSYYTPTSLINCLLDSALDPVVNQAIDVPDREEAKRRLLILKVCDPACGSGHFLIAAANRMALHLARLETQDTEPTTLQIQHAKRQIIGRCIYGVDINEMAVELCKVSLWMEALEPGKPFSFLENHIKCGNSLIGATPLLLNAGVPEAAFNSIDGDDTTVCAQLKKNNKRERTEYKSGQGYLFELYYRQGNMADGFVKLSAADDESLDAINEKEKQYEDLIKGTPYLNARFWADSWCATFVWEKADSDLGRLCPTERTLRDIERNPNSASSLMREEVRKLADQYKFFHWHLAFPDVFFLSETHERAENVRTNWNGGFDIVLGNPPWERLKLQEKEWFSDRVPAIAAASNTARRQKLITELHRTAPEIIGEFSNARRHSEGSSHFVRHSNAFPLCGRGDVNTYTLFTELNRHICSIRGRIGCIIPPGIATDDTTKFFFQDLIENQCLVSLFAFINEARLFPIDHRNKFALLTMSGDAGVERSADFAFGLYLPEEIKDGYRVFSLSVDDIALLNPNTRTCPIFTSNRVGELTKLIYRRLPVLSNESNETAGWNVSFTRMYDMSTDSKNFHTKEVLRSASAGILPNQYMMDTDLLFPLYEGKMIWQDDHRFGTYDGQTEAQARAGKLPELSHSDKADPLNLPIPRYWVSEMEFKSRPEKISRALFFYGFREVTNAILLRTIVFAIIPPVPVGHKVPLLHIDAETKLSASFYSGFNSFVFDFVARQKIGGVSMSYFVMRQLPVVPKKRYSQIASWCTRTLEEVFLPCVVELAFTSWDLFAFAAECNYDGPPFRWDEDRRFQIRCELDSAYFVLYLGSKGEWGSRKGEVNREGVNEPLLEMFPTPRDAVSYIMDTFPIVRRKDEAKYGEYRTKRVILEIYDQMTEVIEANETIRTANPDKSEDELRPLLRSYQSPLNPPPGPPTDANGNFISYADWTEEIRSLYSTVIHPPKVDLRGRTQEELAFDVLLVLEAWKVPASIRAIEGALLLLRDDQARANLIGYSGEPKTKSSGVDVAPMQGISQIYDALCTNGVLEQVGTAAYRLLKPELIEEVPESEKAKATQAVEILKSYETPEQAYNEIRKQVNYEYRVKTV